jgi:hypothetical protein
MRIDGDARQVKTVTENHIRGFPTDTSQSVSSAMLEGTLALYFESIARRIV